jgi:hypothetical protein
MGGKTWTDEEMVLLIFFASRGLDDKSIQIRLFLRNPTFDRTIIAVNTELKRIQQGWNFFGEQGEWDDDKVDAWIRDKDLGDQLEDLIRFGENQLARSVGISSKNRLQQD